MTINELIKRLEELRSIAQKGGETPVATDFVHEENELEWCIAELQPCTQVDAGVWRILDDGNDTEVVRIF